MKTIRIVCSFIIYLSLGLALSCTESEAENWFFVKSVCDGDTIVMADGTRVRYIGIDTPEVQHEGSPAEPFGAKASEYNTRLVLGRKVRLEFDREKYDRYGRLLAYIYLPGDVFINQQLIEKGYAHFLYREPNTKYNDRLLRAQRKAMNAGIGIWKGRELKKGNKGFIGNRRSMRFHDINCPFGKKVSKKNKIFFERDREAFLKGYSPCKRCKYK